MSNTSFPLATPFVGSAANHSSVTAPLSSSQLYRQAAGIAPGGEPVTRPCTCVLCGAKLLPDQVPPHRAGPMTEKKFGDAFTNKRDIRGDGDVVCGDCIALWRSEFMQSAVHGKSYAIQGRGVFRLHTNQNVAAFVLFPPTAPYVAVYGLKKQSHLIWRTPVSYPSGGLADRNLLEVRIDEDLVTVDRARAMRGARAWQYIRARLKALNLNDLPGLNKAHLDSVHTGLVFPNVQKAMNKDGPASQKALSDLLSLSMADWWALCALREIDMDAPKTWPAPECLSPLVLKGDPDSEGDE